MASSVAPSIYPHAMRSTDPPARDAAQLVGRSHATLKGAPCTTSKRRYLHWFCLVSCSALCLMAMSGWVRTFFATDSIVHSHLREDAPRQDGGIWSARQRSLILGGGN